MSKDRFEFVVVKNDLAPASFRYVATLGEYDLEREAGRGPNPARAIIDWLEIHEDKLT